MTDNLLIHRIWKREVAERVEIGKSGSPVYGTSIRITERKRIEM